MTKGAGEQATATEGDQQNRVPVLLIRIIGLALLLAGLGCAALGPAELYVYYWFAPGGRFHYPGFQFGSFLFAFLAVQIIGYYAIAAACVPLGYGHLKLRPWARALALAGLGFWMVVGIPMAVLFMAVLVTSKEPSWLQVLAAGGAMVVLYPVLPVLLWRFYRSPAVRAAFGGGSGDDSEAPRWTLCLLYAFWIAALHVAILFRGAYPVLGKLVTELPGALCIDIAVLVLALLAWGTWQRRAWAWWGALAYFIWSTVSTLVTLGRMSWDDLLVRLQYPPTEMQALSGIPATGAHVAALIGLPLVGTLVAILHARRSFDGA
jgi:hypothetical protein